MIDNLANGFGLELDVIESRRKRNQEHARWFTWAHFLECVERVQSNSHGAPLFTLIST